MGTTGTGSNVDVVDQKYSGDGFFSGYRNLDDQGQPVLNEQGQPTFKLEPIRMKAAPKFQGSVESRVRLTIAKLQAEEFLVSSQCTAICKMFQNLVSEKQGKTYDPNIAFKPRRSIYVHPFDAMSYVLLYYNSTNTELVGETKSEIIDIGA